MDKLYDDVIVKSKTICDKWYNRNLTLMGRVLLVNSLIGSLYVYLLQVNPSPNEKHINKFHKFIESFLWPGQHTRPKLSLRQLQAQKKNGGLKLVDLRHKDVAIKIDWLFKQDEHS